VQLASLKGEANAWLSDESYDVLRHRLEDAHAAVEAQAAGLVVFPQILGDTGREPLFAGLPDVNLELPGTDVLDGRLVTLEYRSANANPSAEPRR
jgi:hypothetical protein